MMRKLSKVSVRTTDYNSCLEKSRMDSEYNTPESNSPDTQNVDSQCFTQSQNTDINVPQLWGRLCPHHTSFQTVELTKDEYTFGRLLDCDISVKGKISAKKESIISKVHFRIYRKHCVTSSSLEDEVVYLKDESQNGTFVNNQLVGKGKSVLLVNNDLIAVAKSIFNVFVYMSISGYDNSILPEALRSKYAVSRNLGAGACGVVKLCFSKSGLTGKKFAIKIMSKKTINQSDHKNRLNDEKHIMNEISIGKALKHPCIIKIEEVFDSPTMVYIVLELMEGGELFERIKKNNGLSEKNAKFIFYQVVLAVNYLHENAITHRDLKPENILLADHEDETIVKVSDFGLSKIVDSQTMLKTFCGTPMYVAPEILKTGGKGTYDCQVDVWSLGVILYCMLSGLTPFKLHDQANTLYDQITKGMYNFNSSKFFNVSSSAKDLIKRMMTVDPKKRITIQNVLSHSWFQDDEMLIKINKILRISNNENAEPKKTYDNLGIDPVKVKRARFE